jgi:spermidine/putrescine transport system substrate-binding protein
MEKIDANLAKSPFIFPTEETLKHVKVFRGLTPDEESKYTEAFQAATGN